MAKYVTKEFALSDDGLSVNQWPELGSATTELVHGTKRLLDEWGNPKTLRLVDRDDEVNTAAYDPIVLLVRAPHTRDYNATVILAGERDGAEYTGLTYQYREVDNGVGEVFLDESDRFFAGHMIDDGQTEIDAVTARVDALSAVDIISRTARALGALTDNPAHPTFNVADYQWLMVPSETA
ncbi:MAG TPA: hypothetical protein VJP80_04265 [Candidatus Saccharimonadales bacterium]|nr:hypothetical protein [Candidatus Saccharimonadales bacterium]